MLQEIIHALLPAFRIPQLKTAGGSQKSPLTDRPKQNEGLKLTSAERLHFVPKAGSLVLARNTGKPPLFRSFLSSQKELAPPAMRRKNNWVIEILSFVEIKKYKHCLTYFIHQGIYTYRDLIKFIIL